MNTSPGFISAMNAAWFAWLPEFGCTLANLQSNSWVARSMAIRLEDPRFVHKSPYVRAATSFAIAVTCYAALLAIASAVAWVTERRPKLDRPRTPL